jgi:hypothetical protein
MTVVILPVVAALVIPVLPVLSVPVLTISMLTISMLIISMLMIAIAPASAVLVFPVVPGAVEPRLVFRRSNEVHGSIAGVVFTAVLAPVPRVTRGHVQVDGRRRLRLRHDQHRLRIHEGRRPVIAKLNLAVYTGRHLTR